MSLGWARADVLDKRPVTVTGWVMRGVRRRSEFAETAVRVEAPDQEISGSEKVPAVRQAKPGEGG